MSYRGGLLLKNFAVVSGMLATGRLHRSSGGIYFLDFAVAFASSVWCWVYDQ